MKQNIALVLASGGARGLAHIGVIEALEQEGFNITSIAGTSMGALVGGFYAAGKLGEFREWMKTINKKKIFSLTDFSLSLNHFVKGQKIIDTLQEFIPDTRIENLPIPFCAVATDWKTGKEVTFRRGSLFTAIRSSISIPSVFDPVKGNGLILIDGGIINPFPLNRVERTEGDILVGADVSNHDFAAQTAEEERRKEELKNDESIKQAILNKLVPDNIDFNYISVLSRCSQIMIRQNSKLMRRLCSPDMTIDMAISQYNMMDFHCSEELIAIGREKTLERIKLYKEQHKTPDSQK